MMKSGLLILFLLNLNMLSADDSCRYKVKADFVVADACPGQDACLTNISQVGSSKVFWKWDFGDGRTSNKHSPELSYGISGYKKIKLKVIDSISSCSDSTSKFVEVYRKPESNFHCQYKYIDGDRHRLYIAANTSIIDHSFHWFMPNGDSIYITGKNHLLLRDTLTIKDHYIKLVVKSNEGCTSATLKEYKLVGIDEISCPVYVLGSPSTLFLEFKSMELGKCLIYNEMGEIVDSFPIVEGLNRSKDLASGVYFAEFQFDNHKTSVQKFVVE